MFIFSILYHIFGVVLCIVSLTLAFLVFVLCYPFDRGRRAVHYINAKMSNIFFMIPPCWTRREEGLENIDRTKSYVIVMNHTVMMDIPVMYKIPMCWKWVSKRQVFNLPIVGQYLMLRADIAIDRGNAKEAMQQVITKGTEVIRMGQSVAIFPEGTRSKSGVIGPFKTGAFNLAKEAGVEILPIVIEGSDRVINPQTGRYSWRNRITLKVLPPVKCTWSDNVECKELIERVREMMMEALDEIKNRG